MLKEVDDVIQNNNRTNNSNIVYKSEYLKYLKIYSPWSTAARSLLLLNKWPKENSNVLEVIPSKFAKLGIEFHRMIGTDDLLAKHLILELKRRGIDIRDPNNHVALITEWDTLYGRAFPLTFAAQLECMDETPNHVANTLNENVSEGYKYPPHYIFTVIFVVWMASCRDPSSKKMQP